MHLFSFQPKYYDGNYKKMLEILIGCKNMECTFLVGGRNVDGIFKVCLPNKRLLKSPARFSLILLSCGDVMNALESNPSAGSRRS